MNPQFKKGIVEMCVLHTISKSDKYGFEIVAEINDFFEISSNTIYPILRRFTKENLCTTYLVESSSGPARKYYSLTSIGKEHLNKQVEEYYMFSNQVNTLLKGDN